ncbi:MAG TPA: hypothetical protein VEI08_03325 [Candidatus Bathyarchaeia archaeon]|nr:hypothetical protein [Candidatus Bathyarchaeia archaeon]
MRERIFGAAVLCAVIVAALIILAGPARGAGRAQSFAAARDCDRQCLYGFVDQYLAALVAHDPARLPWAKNVLFTENNVALQVGDGLWGTITALGAEDVRAADPENGQVAYYGVVDERGNQAFLALRMRIVDRQISEAETIVDRKGYGPGPFGDPATLKPVPVLLEDVAPENRRPRERMIALADGYFNTLQLNDGAIFTQFADDCSRRENGVWTANDPHPDPNATSGISAYGKISCEQGFKLGNYRWDDRLRARRFPLVDEQKGLVLAGGFIDHAGTLVTYTTTDGVKHDSPMKSPHSFCFLEMFKIVDGKIRHAEAMFITVPYNMPSPWVK